MILQIQNNNEIRINWNTFTNKVKMKTHKSHFMHHTKPYMYHPFFQKQKSQKFNKYPKFSILQKNILVLGHSTWGWLGLFSLLWIGTFYMAMVTKSLFFG